MTTSPAVPTSIPAAGAAAGSALWGTSAGDRAGGENGIADLILFISTARGKEMAARLAARLGAGLCSGCTALAFDKARARSGWSASHTAAPRSRKLTSTASPSSSPCPPGLSSPRRLWTAGRATRGICLPRPPSAVRILERKPKEKVAKDIAEARVIVLRRPRLRQEGGPGASAGAGRRAGRRAGATRPLTEEMHWLPEDLCIGLSGVQVKPELYVGLGVSGQIQHMTGVRGAKVVCAVNRDENAPIFALSDFGSWQPLRGRAEADRGTEK